MAFFAPVEIATRSILGVILDWLSVLVVFVLIYMLFRLFANGKGIGDLFNGWNGNNDGSGKSGRSGKSGKDGTNNGPEDTSKDYPEWADGFGTVSVWVTDEDDNPIQGAIVELKHRKIPKMSKKMRGPTGAKGTYGPKRIPAGPVMVKAYHRNYLQLGIWTAGGALIGGAISFLGTSLSGIGALAGLSSFRGDRYYMKDWFILEKDKEEVFHIRLKRKNGQADHAFEPHIRDVVLNESQPDGRAKSRLVGEVHIQSHNPEKYGGTRGRDY